MLTSLGFHTFTIVLRLTYEEIMELYRAFQRYRDNTGKMRIRPTGKDKKNPGSLPKGYIIEYISKAKGLTWYLRFDDKMSSFMDMSLDSRNPNYLQVPKSYSVKATINPKIFSGISDYLTAANSDYLGDVETRFNAEAKKISPILSQFEFYSLNRIDYCLNIDLKELRFPCSSKKMMTLLKRGDIPEYYYERKEYDKTSHRQKTNKNALYLQSNSVTINCYRKYEQLRNEFPDCPDLESSRDLIRFEVQCKYSKVYSMSRIIKADLRMNMTLDELEDDIQSGVTNPTKEMLSDTLSRTIIRNYFNKVVGTGDYLTLDLAREMVEEHNFRQEKEKRLIAALEKVNECRGIAKVKAILTGRDLDNFKRSIRDLNLILVNPVTIPRDWGIKHIPNPHRAFYINIAEERLVSEMEIEFEKLLAECLSKY